MAQPATTARTRLLLSFTSDFPHTSTLTGDPAPVTSSPSRLDQTDRRLRQPASPWTAPDGANASTWSTAGFDLLWRETGTDSALRRSWNDRKDPAKPLVLLAPAARDSKVRVCGPNHDKPIRELSFEPVSHLLLNAARTALQ